MRTFDVSLRALGDMVGLPATARLGDGRLSIKTEAADIGDWDLSEVRFEEIPTGYRMSAEGDLILIELTDYEEFAIELRENSLEKRAPRSPKRGRGANPATTANSAAEGKPTRTLRGIWRLLKPILPKRVFTRAVTGLVLGLILLTLASPAAVTWFLLLSGIAFVGLGVVVYVDSRLSERWLPRWASHVDVLVLGASIATFGIALLILS